jgi:ABC-2 type transport system permease protein
MTTATRADGVELIPVGGSGWTVGFSNLLKKEFGQWWTTKLWWIQIVIWLILLNGVTTVIMIEGSGMTAADLADEAVQTFFLVGATAVSIGIVLTLQGAIVSERELGTAAWVVSKPASRTAFVASKLVAHFTGFAITAIVIPSAVFLVTAQFLLTEPVPLGPFVTGMAVYGLDVLFFVTLTLALGCIFKGRGPIAGIGITLILMGQFFKGMLPEAIVMATPWLLGDVAASYAIQEAPQFDPMVPLMFVAAEIVILAIVGIWRFNREEF